jgi:hypothetical protein
LAAGSANPPPPKINGPVFPARVSSATKTIGVSGKISRAFFNRRWAFVHSLQRNTLKNLYPSVQCRFPSVWRMKAVTVRRPAERIQATATITANGQLRVVKAGRRGRKMSPKDVRNMRSLSSTPWVDSALRIGFPSLTALHNPNRGNAVGGSSGP